MRKEPDHLDALPVAPTIGGPLFGDTSGELASEPTPFDNSGNKPTPEERMIAYFIWKHRGSRNPVSVAKLNELSKLDQRTIKGTVQQLRVNHHCPIGARREEPAGYFWIVDEADRKAAVGPYRAQLLSMWDTLRVLDSPVANRELLDQMRSKL